LFYIPLFLQRGDGLGAFDTGLLLLAPAVVTVIMMPISGWLYDRIGARWPAVIGLGIVAWSTYLMHVMNTDTSRGQFMVWLALRQRPAPPGTRRASAPAPRRRLPLSGPPPASPSPHPAGLAARAMPPPLFPPRPRRAPPPATAPPAAHAEV